MILRKLAMWVFKEEWIPLGLLAPHVLAIALGCKSYGRVKRVKPVEPHECGYPDGPCYECETSMEKQI